MTLIGIATYGKQRAEVITDTSGYTKHVESLSRSSKVHPIPHLDALVIPQGDSVFGALVSANAALWARDAVDFDGFTESVPRLARQIQGDLSHDIGPSAVFVVGYSTSRDRFVAYGFPADDDFAPFEIKGAFCVPMPLTWRPSDMELGRAAQHAHPSDVEALRNLPTLPKPADREDWLSLGMAARTTRALAPVWSGLKVIVMGQLWHTTLTRGGVHMEKALEFDDSGEEFLTMVNGTRHPLGLAGDCPCGSGKRFAECCLAGRLAEPCECGSTKALRECCAAEGMPATA